MNLFLDIFRSRFQISDFYWCNIFKNVFQLQMIFENFCGSFRIGLFVSSDTCKGKAAYTRISPYPV